VLLGALGEDHVKMCPLTAEKEGRAVSLSFYLDSWGLRPMKIYVVKRQKRG